jgi:hypothetical protein
MADDKIVPFGKYKGQPVEADESYMQWLLAQDWFKAKCGNFYTLIVNNFTEPDETPEHNALQVLFLEDAFCIRVLNQSGLVREWQQKAKEHRLFLLQKDLHNATEKRDWWKRDVETLPPPPVAMPAQRSWWHFGRSTTPVPSRVLDPAYRERELRLATSQALVDRLTKEIAELEALPVSEFEIPLCFKRSFEGSVDVTLDMQDPDHPYSNDPPIKIEIKPSVGEDYPAILRRLLAVRGWCEKILFLENYVGKGATEQQFVKIFTESGIRVVFRRDLGSP